MQERVVTVSNMDGTDKREVREFDLLVRLSEDDAMQLEACRAFYGEKMADFGQQEFTAADAVRWLIRLKFNEAL